MTALWLATSAPAWVINRRKGGKSGRGRKSSNLYWQKAGRTRRRAIATSHKPRICAPKLIAKDSDAKGYKKAEFTNALARLMDRKLAIVETVKPGTTREKKIVVFV
jgi:hypothetical protein